MLLPGVPPEVWIWGVFPNERSGRRLLWIIRKTGVLGSRHPVPGSAVTLALPLHFSMHLAPQRDVSFEKFGPICTQTLGHRHLNWAISRHSKLFPKPLITRLVTDMWEKTANMQPALYFLFLANVGKKHQEGRGA